MKILILVFIFVSLTACAFDPIAYDELRKQEHEDHLKQNGY
jgi:cytochrome c biogenesis protein ResB